MILEKWKAPHIALQMLRYGGHAGFPMIFGAIFDKYHCCSILTFWYLKMFFMSHEIYVWHEGQMC